MAEYSTPLNKKYYQESSVFMTPSSSCGRTVYNAPKSFLTTPIAIQSMTPMSTPTSNSAIREEHTDIVTSLYECGIPKLADHILSLLDPSEIASCRLVCQSWNAYIISRKLFTVKPLPPPKSQNFTDENSQSSQLVKSRRPPLTALNCNSLDKKRPQDIQAKQSTQKVGSSVVKYRPCPQCQSPAKKLNARRAECSKCSFDFCQDCLRNWHEELCLSHRDVQLSPKKSQNNTSIAGTKKSKRRLKRL